MLLVCLSGLAGVVTTFVALWNSDLSIKLLCAPLTASLFGLLAAACIVLVRARQSRFSEDRADSSLATLVSTERSAR